MKKHVWEYIIKCILCQKNEHSIKKKLSYPQLLEYLIKLWEFVSMDIITKLLKSKDPITGITYNII